MVMKSLLDYQAQGLQCILLNILLFCQFKATNWALVLTKYSIMHMQYMAYIYGDVGFDGMVLAHIIVRQIGAVFCNNRSFRDKSMKLGI